MLKHEYKINMKRPDIRPTYFDFGRTQQDLYDMDRLYAIEYEGYTDRELLIYDKNIEIYKKKQEQYKDNFIQLVSYYLLDILGNKKINSFSLWFNEYNGYSFKVNGYTYHTYNYLKPDFIVNTLEKELCKVIYKR